MVTMPLPTPRIDPTSRDALANVARAERNAPHGYAPLALWVAMQLSERVPTDRWAMGLLMAAKRVVG